jgi:hypothetical protein
MRAGPVVRRESIPLAQLESLAAGSLGASYLLPEEARSRIVHVSDDTALFSASDRTSPFDEAAVVNKGSVTIKGQHAEVTYRASFLATVVMIVWFGGLLAWEITLLFWSQKLPLGPALVGLAMMLGMALLIRYSARKQIGILRGITAEAAMSLWQRRARR